MSDDSPDLLANPADHLDEGGGRAAASYRVKLEVFEGPLDLLLHLIKREEVEIVDIPIASITDQYLAYIEVMRDLNLDIAGEFLVMAATLTLLKSRMLLPHDEGGEDEQEEADLRADLVRQLLEYQRFRETAQQLAERPMLHRDVFAREPAWDEVPPDAEGVPQIRASVWDLLEAFRAILARAQPQAVHEVVSERISLRDRVQSLLRTLSVAKSIEFDSLFEEDVTRLEIIVTFLAVLELVRMQAVRAVQEQLFDRIVITLEVTDIAAVSLDLADEYDGRKAEEGQDGAGADGRAGAGAAAGDGAVDDGGARPGVAGDEPGGEDPAGGGSTGSQSDE